MANIQTSNPYEQDDDSDYCSMCCLHFFECECGKDEQCEDCGGRYVDCRNDGCPYASIEGV